MTTDEDLVRRLRETARRKQLYPGDNDYEDAAQRIEALTSELAEREKERDEARDTVEELRKELEEEETLAYEEGYSEGQSDAKGAHNDLWDGVLALLFKHDLIEHNVDGHAAQDLLDGIYEYAREIAHPAKHALSAAEARIKALEDALRPFAEVADLIPSDQADFKIVAHVPAGPHAEAFRRVGEKLTAGNFRAAAATFGGQKQ